MPLFLITSVCDEGVSATSFKVVEAESRSSIAQDILDRPYDWEPLLCGTLAYYPYRYGEPRGWTAADLLSRIDATRVDGGSRYQFRIHEIKEIEGLPGQTTSDGTTTPAVDHMATAARSRWA